METKKQIKNSFLLIDIIDEKSLAILNRVAGRYYRKSPKQKITVRRQDKSYKFWDKLLKTNKEVVLKGDN